MEQDSNVRVVSEEEISLNEILRARRPTTPKRKGSTLPSKIAFDVARMLKARESAEKPQLLAIPETSANENVEQKDSQE